MATIKRNCDYCGIEYDADPRNLKRGWGLTCSKSCAAKKRAHDKPVSTPAIKPITAGTPSGAIWHDAATDLPIPDSFVLGHKVEWEDKVYNPSGVRMCYYDKDGYFMSAIWNRVRDTWDEVYGDPTHWMELSKVPKP